MPHQRAVQEGVGRGRRLRQGVEQGRGDVGTDAQREEPLAGEQGHAHGAFFHPPAGEALLLGELKRAASHGGEGADGLDQPLAERGVAGLPDHALPLHGQFPLACGLHILAVVALLPVGQFDFFDAHGVLHDAVLAAQGRKGGRNVGPEHLGALALSHGETVDRFLADGIDDELLDVAVGGAQVEAQVGILRDGRGHPGGRFGSQRLLIQPGKQPRARHPGRQQRAVTHHVAVQDAAPGERSELIESQQRNPVRGLAVRFVEAQQRPHQPAQVGQQFEPDVTAGRQGGRQAGSREHALHERAAFAVVMRGQEAGELACESLHAGQGVEIRRPAVRTG